MHSVITFSPSSLISDGHSPTVYQVAAVEGFEQAECSPHTAKSDPIKSDMRYFISELFG